MWTMRSYDVSFHWIELLLISKYKHVWVFDECVCVSVCISCKSLLLFVYENFAFSSMANLITHFALTILQNAIQFKSCVPGLMIILLPSNFSLLNYYNNWIVYYLGFYSFSVIISFIILSQFIVIAGFCSYSRIFLSHTFRCALSFMQIVMHRSKWSHIIDIK